MNQTAIKRNCSESTKLSSIHSTKTIIRTVYGVSFQNLSQQQAIIEFTFQWNEIILLSPYCDEKNIHLIWFERNVGKMQIGHRRSTGSETGGRFLCLARHALNECVRLILDASVQINWNLASNKLDTSFQHNWYCRSISGSPWWGGGLGGSGMVFRNWNRCRHGFLFCV